MGAADRPADRNHAGIIPGRLLEAREYLGFSRADVAAALGWAAGQVEDIESGGCTITGYDLRRLARLYRRPITWLQGETTFRPSPEMLRQLNENPRLTGQDREAVLDFAEWLAGAGPAPKPRRTRAGKEAGDG